MSGTNVAPVIIKRKKVVAGGGHHGGAWKVAYADFVTAMMAFFMLMWLLNATTEKQRKGIADYFNPTIPVNRISGGGEGSFGGTSVFSEQTLAQAGMGASNKHATKQNQARGQSGLAEQGVQGNGASTAKMQELEDLLMARGGESMVSDQLLKHIVTRVTDEGLIVELFDREGAPLFSTNGQEPSPQLRALIPVVAEVFGLVTNEVAVEAHTHAHPMVLREDPAWALSTARAQAVRTLLESAGIQTKRIQRVTGHADREPAARNPMAARNNRLELILLRDDE
ncbi:chemotaxis protein MotB [Actibacterium mucosum KCTC 23349]|uniref:Chemotaxis protein MotB n=1 Tax=Actibacterium mucosum KCTC 23349 TaxID=1454373 RepID=A0A037ZR43_9RHOB|nr:flagellar motor protein MotB [Actibacterium mucosum]KAJ57322.1 chemotaxis protein MotB [Actibacterium mucosum KCTC 23349]